MSAVISFVTFKVYANMTRFEWAYPSGQEGQEGRGEWIQGQTMVLAKVIMSMVYLTSETRARVGEPGINDPNIKLAVVLFTFFVLWMLQARLPPPPPPSRANPPCHPLLPPAPRCV